MNSLEFIDEEIKYWKKTINTARSEKLTQTIIVSLNPLHKIENVTLSDYDILLIEEKLQILQQIKSELEIMELIKNGWSSMEQTLSGEKIIKFQKLNIDDWLKVWKTLEEIGLQKALEVKDNENR